MAGSVNDFQAKAVSQFQKVSFFEDTVDFDGSTNKRVKSWNWALSRLQVNVLDPSFLGTMRANFTAGYLFYGLC